MKSHVASDMKLYILWGGTIATEPICWLLNFYRVLERNNQPSHMGKPCPFLGPKFKSMYRQVKGLAEVHKL